MLAIANLAYEGEPIKVRSEDLPLHEFDALFRKVGHMMLIALWGGRCMATVLFPSSLGRNSIPVWTPGAIYIGQAALRHAIFYLHKFGVIFNAQRGVWFAASIPNTHVPHVMSDHILLSAAVMGGAACEAVMPFLDSKIVKKNVFPRKFMSAYAFLAATVSLLISLESYFTARYFHPPAEIVLGAVLGLVIFQIPLLFYSYSSLKTHEVAVNSSRVSAWSNGAY